MLFKTFRVPKLRCQQKGKIDDETKNHRLHRQETMGRIHEAPY